jgi:hypothetical protein
MREVLEIKDGGPNVGKDLKSSVYKGMAVA